MLLSNSTTTTVWDIQDELQSERKLWSGLGTYRKMLNNEVCDNYWQLFTCYIKYFIKSQWLTCNIGFCKYFAVVSREARKLIEHFLLLVRSHEQVTLKQQNNDNIICVQLSTGYHLTPVRYMEQAHHWQWHPFWLLLHHFLLQAVNEVIVGEKKG